MRKIALFFALLLLISVIGCSHNAVSSDNPAFSQKVTASEGDPLDSNDGQEGDPDGMGSGNGKIVPTEGDPLDGNEGDPDSMGDGLG